MSVLSSTLVALLLTPVEFPDAMLGDFCFDEAPPDYWVSRKFFDPECCDLFLLDCLFSGLACCCLSAAASLNLTFTESLTIIVNIFEMMFPSAWMASETLSTFAVITWYFATFLTR